MSVPPLSYKNNLYVLAAGDGEFKIISRLDIEDKPVQSSIAIADDQMFIRTANMLFCIGN